MVGSTTYLPEEISFILGEALKKSSLDATARGFFKEFDKPISHNQIRYVKTKYGRCARYNSPLINKNLGNMAFRSGISRGVFNHHHDRNHAHNHAHNSNINSNANANAHTPASAPSTSPEPPPQPLNPLPLKSPQKPSA
ncbi:hypothetical protein CDD80_549 [Ophiocordyceps camponoti-rufipedis]|uniref:Uncharacterized protein n=1 Tax=Ophiocordyceps camponoti-rufipedis TaxID=2004952 RepID=A0A2C5Z6K8_9HYPO|nr:hypothetical protein CDD80_549 [Ophiocordyceps camponoti-rufipedis]